MKTKITWFDRMMAAVTFAEANEHDAGKGFLAGTEHKSVTEQTSKECDVVLTADLHGVEAQS